MSDKNSKKKYSWEDAAKDTLTFFANTQGYGGEYESETAKNIENGVRNAQKSAFDTTRAAANAAYDAAGNAWGWLSNFIKNGSKSNTSNSGLTTDDARKEQFLLKKQSGGTSLDKNTDYSKDYLRDTLDGTGDGSGGNSTRSYSFTPSDTYTKAMDYTNQLLAKLSAGRTSYTDRINSLMDSISNREAFSYDMDKDTLFQNALSSAMNSGQVAMQDTMGQAASLTGGYGSTYATSAANQAYNGYIQDAYSQLPDYYQLAMDAYNQEGQNLYNQLAMYQTADDSEYSRLANAYSANAQAASNIYDQEYNNYWQNANMTEDILRYEEDKKASSDSSAYQAQKDALELYGKYGVYADENGNVVYDQTKENGVSPKQYTQDMYDAALALARNGGTDEGSEYYNYLNYLAELGYDIDTLDAKITTSDEFKKGIWGWLK